MNNGDNRTYQIHVFEQSNHKDIYRHLVVREYCHTHPDITAKYGKLKMELVDKFPENIEGYCDGKYTFVKQMEIDALLWYQSIKR
ncbi:GrpB family protein [Tissierellaceae bacterium HCP3S3_D8]